MVHHLTDATVVQINRPAGDHGEARPYFCGEYLVKIRRFFIYALLLIFYYHFYIYTGKHKLYCLKVETSVYLNGEACNWTSPVPGTTADITLFRSNIAFHKASTRKSPAALTVTDHGKGYEQHPKRHAIVLDKAYIGVESLIRWVIIIIIFLQYTYSHLV